LSIEFTIFKKDGSESGEKMVFDQPSFTVEPHDHSIWLAVKAEMTNSRQGTASSKTRAEVRGGGRKPWKQKGRGTARAGSSTSPVWVGGGRAFGPKPKIYGVKINQKVKRLARQSALAYKYQNGGIIVVEDFNFSDSKAKNVRELLEKFNISDKRITMLATEITENLSLAARNFYNILLVEAERASTYDLLDCEVLLIDRAGFEKLNNRLLANK